MRYFCILLGAVLLLLFFLPILLGIIGLNVGNLTGLFLSLLLLLYGLFGHILPKRLQKNARARLIERVILSFTGICCALGLIETIFIVQAVYVNSYERFEEAEVYEDGNLPLIVLGCGVVKGQPSLMMQERLDVAFDYLSSHPDSVAILCGGGKSIKEITEALCMYNTLSDMGIAEDRLIMEDTSVNTRENFSNAAVILKELGISQGEDVPCAVVVTSEFHCFRSGMIAEQESLNVCFLTSRTDLLYLPTYWLRELYAILYEILF